MSKKSKKTKVKKLDSAKPAGKPAIPSQGAFARAHEAWLERNKRRG